MTGSSWLAHVESQEGDQCLTWIRSAVKADHSWLMVDFMPIVEGVASNKVVLTRAWGFEQGSGVKMSWRKRTMSNVFGC